MLKEKQPFYPNIHCFKTLNKKVSSIASFPSTIEDMASIQKLCWFHLLLGCLIYVQVILDMYCLKYSQSTLVTSALQMRKTNPDWMRIESIHFAMWIEMEWNVGGHGLCHMFYGVNFRIAEAGLAAGILTRLRLYWGLGGAADVQSQLCCIWKSCQ